jgi:uncharacterized PurR-regulated membrane protein YhhQ (DUF165 family)
MTILLLAAYLGAIVLANLLVVALGPSVVILNALVLIGLDLTVRDVLHERWQGRALWLRMAALIATGGLISWALNAEAYLVALASTLAFVAASVTDALVYQFLSAAPRLTRMNVSNVCSALVDSWVFPLVLLGTLAGQAWLVMGLWIAKVAGGLIWSLILARAVPERRPAA